MRRELYPAGACTTEATRRCALAQCQRVAMLVTTPPVAACARAEVTAQGNRTPQAANRTTKLPCPHHQRATIQLHRSLATQLQAATRCSVPTWRATSWRRNLLALPYRATASTEDGWRIWKAANLTSGTTTPNNERAQQAGLNRSSDHCAFAQSSACTTAAVRPLARGLTAKKLG
jgi:hypothetical protein